jgi:ribA/ribD-fused uncharacterized protein
MTVSKDTADPLYFYTKSMEFWGLSNFSPPGFELDGKYWPTVEHFYQAQKFVNAEFKERVRLSDSPKDARTLGQSRRERIIDDWDIQRNVVMLKALREKFKNPTAKKLLESTGDRALIEASPYDHYWGCGQDGTGENWLGKLLEQIREEGR